MDIFVSWGSPDRDIAEELGRRLKAVGLDVFFSGFDMRTGDDPNDRVPEALAQARIAIFALSDESVAREWVRDEVAMCAGQLRSRAAPMRRLMPLVVGDLEDEAIPRSIRDLNLHRLDMTVPASREIRLEWLIREIFEELGRERPIVLPAAIFAMNARQFQDLYDEDGSRFEGLLALCAAVGMNGAADSREILEKFFAGRYRETRDEFTPFGARLPLRRIIDQTISGLNAARLERKLRPIFHRWDHDILLDPEADRPDWFVRSRRSQGCLTVVDSLSAFHAEILDGFRETPFPDRDSRSALIWLPPYFPRAADLASLTLEVANVTQRMHDAFLSWQEPEERWVTFDTGTEISLRQWLFRAVGELARDPEPDGGRLRSVAEENPSKMVPDFF